MLQLYARVLFTDSLPALKQIADETSELYKRRNIRQRKKNQKSFYFSTMLTVVESQGILSNILEQRSRPSAFHNFAFAIIVPFFVTFQEERVMKIRTVFSSLIQTLPLSDNSLLQLFQRCCQVSKQRVVPEGNPSLIGDQHKDTGSPLFFSKTHMMGFNRTYTPLTPKSTKMNNSFTRS
jgi:hypothetical protein